jgi:hypothetical protein
MMNVQPAESRASEAAAWVFPGERAEVVSRQLANRARVLAGPPPL